MGDFHGIRYSDSGVMGCESIVLVLSGQALKMETA
jgi:hypothetical protein